MGISKKVAGTNSSLSASLPLLVVISGPTAIGKTSLSVGLALRFNTQIVSADSRQFYKEMKIGTAVPTMDELAKVQHHFIGTHSVTDAYNVYRFEYEAVRTINELLETNAVTILTGGSGLYIRAICDGIDELPDPEPEIRTKLVIDYENFGLESLQQKLNILDPEYYSLVDIKNPARLIRALEVCIQTGKSFTSFRTRQVRERPFRILKIALSMDRSCLFNRIDNRVDEMCKSGLFEEAIELLPYRSLQALNTVGYKEIFEFYDGKVDENQTVGNIKINTRGMLKSK